MSKNTIFVERSQGVIYGELMAFAAFISCAIVMLFPINWAWGIVAFFPLLFVLHQLFFKVKIFRICFSVAASFGWAYLMFLFVEKISENTESAWILGIAFFFLMIWAHKDEFDFRSDATINVFEYLRND